MHLDEFREYCLSFKGTSEDLPFDQNTLVFKVMGKMFALTDIELFESINVKCDPEKAEELRERFTAVLPGYHMNKKHWNTILVSSDMNDKELKLWVKHSYDLVVSKLPKKLREELKKD
ncbi:MmcQ/YjbR family DNA-binding protein [Rapidithrix thailandica]|uniref:MmcQ/YjbR family DNA-binding protein n=1 Tax=Rapidithrix thailandica TaxID=413964 RepID=A0AAW9SKS5_9BACT